MNVEPNRQSLRTTASPTRTGFETTLLGTALALAFVATVALAVVAAVTLVVVTAAGVVPAGVLAVGAAVVGSLAVVAAASVGWQLGIALWVGLVAR